MAGVKPHQIDAAGAEEGATLGVQDGIPRWTAGPGFVPAGTTSYTITEDEDGVKLFTATGGDAVVFATKHPGDDFPGTYFFSSPYAGIYWGDGTDTPIYGDRSVNVFYDGDQGDDIGTLGISGRVAIAHGPLDLLGVPLVWRPSYRGDFGAVQSGVGDASLEGSAPTLVGVKGYTTTQRNSLAADITSTGDHYMVFDTDLGKPIWSDGSGGWVDATGTAV